MSQTSGFIPVLAEKKIKVEGGKASLEKHSKKINKTKIGIMQQKKKHPIQYKARELSVLHLYHTRTRNNTSIFISGS